MGDTAKWLKALRRQRLELLDELNKTKLEYEAQLLVAKKRNDWLTSKLIETQRKVRILNYELMRKEEVNNNLRSELRGAQEHRRGAPKTEACAESVASNPVNESGGVAEHDIAV